MGCNTNERPIDIPRSVLLSNTSTSSSSQSDQKALLLNSKETKDASDEREESHPQITITLPSSRVVEISQTFYWPLYSKPIDWIYQQSFTKFITKKQLQEKSRRVAELLYSLEFIQNFDLEDNIFGTNADNSNINEFDSTGAEIVASSPAGDTISLIIEELEEEKEDWFNDLSGGQRSKVELVRKVFLMDECPDVLLLDETMAPLDPRSKALVMTQIKSFCAGSVVIVIYHTDVGREKPDEGDEVVQCVPSNNFFDGNIHVQDKLVHLRSLCP